MIIKSSNQNEITKFKNILTDKEDKTCNSTRDVVTEINATATNRPKIIEVNGHRRILPEGQKASPEKIASAAEQNISLGPTETLVDNYSRKAA